MAASPEERMKILKMVQEGRISAEDGVQLLEALSSAESAANAVASAKSTAAEQRIKGGFAAPGRPVQPPYPTPPASPGSRTSRWFRVLVTDTKTGKTRVNVRLPVSMVDAGIKLGARFAPQVQGLDTEHLMEHLNSGEVGKIVDVYDDEDGEHVEVFIE